MTQINAFDYVFPVIGGTYTSKDELAIRNVYGTSFSLSENIFITAGHVLE